MSLVNPNPLARRRLYGRRLGHKLRNARQQAFDAALPQVAVHLPDTGLLRPEDLFSRPEPVQQCWLEVGFGNGEHMIELARERPEIDIIGCEPFVNGVSAAVMHLSKYKLNNVRLYNGDARDLLDKLPDSCLTRAYLLFPDPWPKRRHHRRRFVNPDNLDLLARKLASGGEFIVATDHQELSRWMLWQVLDHRSFCWLAERPQDWRHRADGEPPTRYEMKALTRGAPCHYFRFRRRSE